jgi:hypothetical protein
MHELAPMHSECHDAVTRVRSAVLAEKVGELFA